MRLILASASPRRAELLKAAGFTFEARPVDVDERVRPGEAPRDYVRRLARDKARAFAAAHPAAGVGADDRLILAADTAVVVDEVILGKPLGDEDARRMLRQLSGRAHDVLTGLSVVAPGLAPVEPAADLDLVEVTTVWFSPLSDADIEWYIASGEGRDKAGAYAIQGLASRFVRRIDGSYSNVVGLPVSAVHELTTRFAVPKFR